MIMWLGIFYSLLIVFGVSGVFGKPLPPKKVKSVEQVWVPVNASDPIQSPNEVQIKEIEVERKEVLVEIPVSPQIQRESQKMTKPRNQGDTYNFYFGE